MTEDTRVYIEIPPKEVNYINRIIEGYEYLGVLTTLNAKRATCQINSTKDTRDTVIAHPSAGCEGQNPFQPGRSTEGLKENFFILFRLYP